MENPTAVGMVLLAFGVLVTIVGGVFGMAVAIKKLFFEKLDPKYQFVTRAELAETLHETHNKIDTLKSDLDEKLDDFKHDMRERMDKMNEYAHKTAHDNLNALNTIGLRVERVTAILEMRPLPKIKVVPEDEPE